MRDIGVFLRKKLTSEDLIDFMVQQGGVALRIGTLDQVNFESEQGWVSVNGDTGLDQVVFDESDLDEVSHELGFQPHAYVSIHIGSGCNSPRLAQRIADRLLALIDGCVDYDGVAGGLGSPPAGWNEGPG